MSEIPAKSPFSPRTEKRSREKDAPPYFLVW